jgi:hypothetical protein
LDAVTIESVRIGDEEKEHREGRCAVSYGSNGRCTPYKVKVVDEDGASITVEVDALSSVETEYEGGA